MHNTSLLGGLYSFCKLYNSYIPVWILW